MTFENLKTEHNCDCITNTQVDIINHYVRRIKGSEVMDKDFLSHWEREIGRDRTNCDEVCSYKGVSINLFKTEYEELILQKYKTTFKINPRKGGYCLKFKFKEGAGKIKHSPEGGDESHHNLLKSDSFSLESLDIIETIKFA